PCRPTIAKRRRPMMRRLITVLLPLISLVVLLVIGEIGLRSYHYARWNLSLIDGHELPNNQPKRYSPYTLDNSLGWRPTENYRFDGKKRSADGTEYDAKISQDDRGFRMFGDPSSHKLKIFVLGDSFTQAVDASDDKTYYAYLKRALDVEVFAF